MSMLDNHRQYIDALADERPPLRRLLYVSRCTLAEEGDERAAAVRRLAEEAALRNAPAGLTGSLLLVEDSFVQVLEGPAEHVERVFEAICCDFRHEDVRLIDLADAHERLFPDWGMACLAQDQETSISLRDDLAEIRFLVGVNAREALRQMREVLDRCAA